MVLENKLGAMGEHWTKASGVVIQNPQCIFFGCDVGIGKILILCLLLSILATNTLRK